MSRTDQLDRDIDAVDVSDPSLYETDSWRPIFARLRSEPRSPLCGQSFGPYWSITRFEDIMAVDSNHQSFSSVGGVSIGDRKPDFEAPNFISMDPPKHDAQRMSVTPAVAPTQLQKMEPLIRERVCQLLDDLPERTPFNWVDRVSVELTTQMLATLFDFPFEDRRKLTAWSASQRRVKRLAEPYQTRNEEPGCLKCSMSSNNYGKSVGCGIQRSTRISLR